MTRIIAFTIVTYLVLFIAPANARKILSVPDTKEKITQQALENYKAKYKRPNYISFPKHAPYSPQIATLGKMLFFDPRLSRNRDLSCNSCHIPSIGWDIPHNFSFESRKYSASRSSMSIENMAWQKHFYWDRHATSLEKQVLRSFTSRHEMNISTIELLFRVKSIETYRKYFGKLFPKSRITMANIIRSIATFERTIVSPKSPFDEWINGNVNAISQSAKFGFWLFNTKADCARCHSGWRFTNDKFYDTGTSVVDLGLAHITGKPSDNFHFKTPSLRNIFGRSSFMHDESFTSVEKVLNHYNKANSSGFMRKIDIKPLDLNSEELSNIMNFLKTLHSDSREIYLPKLPK